MEATRKALHWAYPPLHRSGRGARRSSRTPARRARRSQARMERALRRVDGRESASSRRSSSARAAASCRATSRGRRSTRSRGRRDARSGRDRDERDRRRAARAGRRLRRPRPVDEDLPQGPGRLPARATTRAATSTTACASTRWRAASNGIALHGGLLPFSATFFNFLDYLKPALRLAAINTVREVFVFTHDSVVPRRGRPDAPADRAARDAARDAERASICGRRTRSRPSKRGRSRWVGRPVPSPSCCRGRKLRSWAPAEPTSRAARTCSSTPPKASRTSS